MKTASVRALVLRTAGTNCDQETMHALRLAGAAPELVHVNALVDRDIQLSAYRILVVPGGFTYGDDVAAGKLLANELRYKLGNALRDFNAAGKIIIGICNGFQVLVKAGLLPDIGARDIQGTLTFNDSGQFQCQWVPLVREPSTCRWMNDTDRHWELPIAHGEGKFLMADRQLLQDLVRRRQVVFRYHKQNPNGSWGDIAGICNPAGNVIGMMPHPERFVTPFQHPAWNRTKFARTGWNPAATGVGMQLFEAAVRHGEQRG